MHGRVLFLKIQILSAFTYVLSYICKYLRMVERFRIVLNPLRQIYP